MAAVASATMLLTGLAVVTQPGAAGAASTTRPKSVAAEPGLSTTAGRGVWGTNGRVVDIVTRGSSAWIAGGFDYVGPTTGRGVAVDATTGSRTSSDSVVVDDTVNASAPDGAGGYYLGGSFSRVGTTSRKGLVHILANGSIDTAFAPKVTGTVLSLAYTGGQGGQLLVGGSFAAIGSSTVSSLAALTPSGALVAGFRPSPDGQVDALTVVGNSVYVGGAFTHIGGASQQGIARLDVADGSLDTGFPASTDGEVDAVAVTPGATRSDDVVALGGDFSSVTAAGATGSRSRLAAVTGAGVLGPWAPSLDATVRTLALDAASGTLYAGGAFSTVSGAARSRLAAFSATGSLLPFDAGLSGCQDRHTTGNTNQYVPCTTEVDSLSVTGGLVYAGGVFTTASGSLRHDAAAWSTATSALASWAPMPGARVRTLTPIGSSVVVGGDFTSVGGQYHQGIAKIDLTKGQAVASFVANADNMVVDLELSPDGSRLYAGGSFRAVNGTTRAKVASLDPATGALDPAFSTTVDKDVYSLAARGSSLYVAGLFTTIGGVARGHVARLSASTAAVDPAWKADTTGPSWWNNGPVLTMAVTADGSRVFLGGPFTSVGGSSVTGGVVAVDGTSGAVNPSRLGGVGHCGNDIPFVTSLYLSPDGKRLYGGDACPDDVFQWDAVGLASARANGIIWTQACDGGMQGHLEVNGRFYYGTHGKVCATTANTSNGAVGSRVRQAVFDAATGNLLDYAPFYDSAMGVWAYAAVPGGLLVGGDFTLAGDRNTVQQGLALFSGTP